MVDARGGVAFHKGSALPLACRQNQTPRLDPSSQGGHQKRLGTWDPGKIIVCGVQVPSPRHARQRCPCSLGSWVHPSCHPRVPVPAPIQWYRVGCRSWCLAPVCCRGRAWGAKERGVAGSRGIVSLVQGVCLHIHSNGPCRSSAEDEPVMEFTFIIYVSSGVT
jgi:hypothetical protein